MFFASFNRYRVLQVFFDEPTTPQQLRAISRKLKLGLPSVRNHVRALEKEGFIKKTAILNTFAYVATRSELFRQYRRNDTVLRLVDAGVIQTIIEQSRPNCIILFGSARRGEDVEASDIDLFVQAEERREDWSASEKKLKRKITILYEPEPWRIDEELRMNIVNGIIISGFAAVDEWMKRSSASRPTKGSLARS